MEDLCHSLCSMPRFAYSNGSTKEDKRITPPPVAMIPASGRRASRTSACMHACMQVCLHVCKHVCMSLKSINKVPILLRSSSEWCFWPGQRWSGATRRMHSECREPQGEANLSQRHLRSAPIQYGPITAATKTTKTHEDIIDGGPNDRRPLSRQQLWERSQRSRWEEQGWRWRASLPKPHHN